MPARKPDLAIVNKKKKKKKIKKENERRKKEEKNCPLVDIAVLADHWVKIKELRKLWNMKVTVIPIVISAPGTVPKGLEKGAGRNQTV